MPCPYLLKVKKIFGKMTISSLYYAQKVINILILNILFPLMVHNVNSVMTPIACFVIILKEVAIFVKSTTILIQVVLMIVASVNVRIIILSLENIACYSSPTLY